ncbi:MAG: TonB family protein [Gemmatimonadetes bacterium]|nr:TonB family protein [Gemmatimonadota bacterium]
MFKVLTSDTKRRAISPATLTASVAAHLLLLGGAVFAAGGEPADAAPVTADTVMIWQAPDPPPPPMEQQPAPPAPVDQPASAPVPGEVLQVARVDQVPTEIKPEEPGATPVDPIVYQRDGRLGDVIGTPRVEPEVPTGGADRPVEDMVLDERMVEVRPVLDRTGLSRALERHYPAVLRDSRVSGRVVIEVVVDEHGRPVPGSARVIEASHPAFGDAALRAVDRFRFSPARMMGTAVPVRVTIPIQWTAN